MLFHFAGQHMSRPNRQNLKDPTETRACRNIKSASSVSMVKNKIEKADKYQQVTIQVSQSPTIQPTPIQFRQLSQEDTCSAEQKSKYFNLSTRQLSMDCR